MQSTLLALAVALVPGAAAVPTPLLSRDPAPAWTRAALTPQEGADLKSRFEALEAAGDRAGLVELWRGNQNGALFVIDSYLEGGLALRERAEAAGEQVDEAAIAAMHARALVGAEAAAEALGNFLILDYAAAFTGWDTAERTRFRAGQQAFGQSRDRLAADDAPGALSAAEECLAHARALGDWWGTGMGWTAKGNALAAAGDPLGAAQALATARAVHESLALLGSEYGNLRALVPLFIEAGNLPRARVAAEHAIALARGENDPGMLTDALTLRLTVQEAAGEESAAKETRAEIDTQSADAEPGR